MAGQARKPAIPPRFAAYAEKHDLFALMEDMMKAVIVARPKDPLAYIADFLKRKPTIRAIVYGPPASGRTSVCEKLAGRSGAVHVSLPALLEACKTASDPLSVKISSFLSQPGGVPDDLALILVVQRLRQDDCTEKGWLLSGFPSSRKQALALQTAGVLATHFIELAASDEVVVQRAEQRLQDSETGAVYHDVFMPPPEDRRDKLVPCTSPITGELRAYRDSEQAVRGCYTKAAATFESDQPQDDLVAQIWTHLCRKPRSNAPLIPRVLLLGPIGSGRTSHSESLCKKYGCIHVAVDRLVHQAVHADNNFGRAVQAARASGQEISDKVLLAILADRLAQADCADNGWVLDGFPTTRRQGELLAKAGFDVNRAFVLETSDTVIKERVCHRRLDPLTGQAYHLIFRPPSSDEIADRLVQRPEDTEEATMLSVAAYRGHIEDLLDLYPSAQRLHADQPASTVLETLEGYLVQPQASTPQA